MLTREAKNIKVMLQVLGSGPCHPKCRDAYTGWACFVIGPVYFYTRDLSGFQWQWLPNTRHGTSQVPRSIPSQELHPVLVIYWALNTKTHW